MDLSFEQKIKRFARAHANIALVKYWGKKDDELKTPYQSSLSMTLNSLYTDTGMVLYGGNRDIFYLNGVLQGETETAKISAFLDLFRERSDEKRKVKISSYNNFPTAAGMASSASGFAAMAALANQIYRVTDDDRELSRLTRRGSGSACRSLFGGFVVWHAGDSNQTSFAEPFADASDYAMVIIILDNKRKKISSTSGMRRTVAESIFYPSWVKQAELDFEKMKQAILNKDFSLIGRIAESNCQKMHATTWGVKEPFTYITNDSLKAMDRIRKIRERNLEVYFTMDAGSNVKVFCLREDLEELMLALREYYAEEQLLPSGSGTGYQIRECEDFGKSRCKR